VVGVADVKAAAGHRDPAVDAVVGADPQLALRGKRRGQLGPLAGAGIFGFVFKRFPGLCGRVFERQPDHFDQQRVGLVELGAGVLGDPVQRSPGARAVAGRDLHPRQQQRVVGDQRRGEAGLQREAALGQAKRLVAIARPVQHLGEVVGRDPLDLRLADVAGDGDGAPQVRRRGPGCRAPTTTTAAGCRRSPGGPGHRWHGTAR
jgi:hypothetical protein